MPQPQEMKSIVSLVEDVHAAAIRMGIDVSPKDVGFMISLFLQGMADHPVQEGGINIPAVNNWLYTIAQACDEVKDE